MAVSDNKFLQSRRHALKCMAYGGAGTLFTLAGGVLSPIDLAFAGTDKMSRTQMGTPLFIQISDTHIGFNKEANPDVGGTLTQTIDIVNGMAQQPALIIHTGDEVAAAILIFNRGRERNFNCSRDQPIIILWVLTSI